MFTGTLRFNLDPEQNISDEKIMEVLKAAQLDDLLAKDAKQRNLDLPITENGSNLSSGEKQLICICRAILRVILSLSYTLQKSKIIILDEATANIDVILEQKIQRFIDSEFNESTMLTIAHRLNTITKSDRILQL